MKNKLVLKLLLILFVFSITISDITSQSDTYDTEPLPEFTIDESGNKTAPFYRLTEITVELVKENGLTENVNFRVSYRSEDVLDLWHWKTVKFRLETPQWDQPIFVTKVYKAQIQAGGYNHNDMVDEGKITINEPHPPSISSIYYYESYATFKPYYQYYANTDGTNYTSSDSYKKHTGLVLVFEIEINFPHWNNTDLWYSRTLTDRFLVKKGEISADTDYGEGEALDDYAEPTTSGFELFTLTISIIFVIQIRKKYWKKNK